MTEHHCDKCGFITDGQACNCDFVRIMLSPRCRVALERLIRDSKIDVAEYVRQALEAEEEE